MGNQNKLIQMSHKRCIGFGLEKEISHSKKILNEHEISKTLKENKELIDISRGYIDMIYETLEDKEFIIILTDKNGCILSIKGDNEIVNEFKNLNLIVGSYMDEENIGTNAMGTALTEDKAVQVTAGEHYIEIFHGLTCSAAPIHDINGKIIGALNLTGKRNKQHIHTLGLVIFAVKTIEKDLQKAHIEEILNETYNYMEMVIDSADTGIMIVDISGKIKKINEQGAKILEGDKINFIDNDIEFLIPHWYKILDKFENGERLVTKDIKVKHSNKFKTILKIKPIMLNDNVIGMLIKLKDEKDEKVKGYTGANCTFDDIIGESRIIKNVITNCKIVSNSPSTILIEGESGTGKEVLAQSIHNYSLRRNNKFVAINCGAIPNNLIESELFGYEDGTFTGGKKGGKKGKFELANGGTIFLDEIGEMPLEMQINLLRVIQEGKIMRLGGESEISIDVRIIAATNRDLKKEVLKGSFREDLYYRLCVIPVKLPPLRERIGDVKELINYFLRVKSFKLNKTAPKIKGSLYDKLINYSWPGNIRQLENVIENIVNLDGNLSFELDNECDSNTLKLETKVLKDDSEELGLDLEGVEKRHITKVLRIYNNNICKTSNALGVSRNTLYSKIKKYQIKLL